MRVLSYVTGGFGAALIAVGVLVLAAGPEIEWTVFVHQGTGADSWAQDARRAYTVAEPTVGGFLAVASGFVAVAFASGLIAQRFSGRSSEPSPNDLG